MSAPEDARLKYRQHKSNAKRRGIEFDFTFEEWWDVWAPHYANRGTGPGNLQMCRTRDEGPYKAGNVRIDTRESNSKEAVQTMARRKDISDWTIEGEERRELRDWIFGRDKPFMDYFRRRILEEKDQENGNLEESA